MWVKARERRKTHRSVRAYPLFPHPPPSPLFNFCLLLWVLTWEETNLRILDKSELRLCACASSLVSFDFFPSLLGECTWVRHSFALLYVPFIDIALGFYGRWYAWGSIIALESRKIAKMRLFFLLLHETPIKQCGDVWEGMYWQWKARKTRKAKEI